MELKEFLQKYSKEFRRFTKKYENDDRYSDMDYFTMINEVCFPEAIEKFKKECISNICKKDNTNVSHPPKGWFGD